MWSSRNRTMPGIIPRAAVFSDPEDGDPVAYVHTGTGWEKRDLELGLRNNVEVAVTSGLRAGEAVAVGEEPVLD